MALQTLAVHTRTVAWGDALLASVSHHPRGLRAAVEQIHAVVGAHIGNRNTYAKFYEVLNPANLDRKNLFRVWLLLVAIGETPSEWGVPDSVVPLAYDVPRLRELLPHVDSNHEPAGYTTRAGELPRLDSNQKPAGYASRDFAFDMAVAA